LFGPTPQFSTATLQTNIGNSNYHSMQAEVTLRPTAGLSLQGSYTWSKSLGRTGAFTNPVDRGPDYTLQAGNRAHDFRTNGTFELPIGPNRLLLANSSGTLARIVEGWTMSWIFNTTSGAPADVDAATMLYANGVPDVVGPFDPSRGSVQWQEWRCVRQLFWRRVYKGCRPSVFEYRRHSPVCLHTQCSC
jgi:hypothetical protein